MSTASTARSRGLETRGVVGARTPTHRHPGAHLSGRGTCPHSPGAVTCREEQATTDAAGSAPGHVGRASAAATGSERGAWRGAGTSPHGAAVTLSPPHTFGCAGPVGRAAGTGGRAVLPAAECLGGTLGTAP